MHNLYELELRQWAAIERYSPVIKESIAYYERARPHASPAHEAVYFGYLRPHL